MDFGLRGGQHAYRPYAASLPVRVPTVKGLFPASFGLAARLAPRDFRSAVPYGYLHRSRQDRFILLESAHAGHTGARLQTCRVAIGGDMSWRHDHSPTSAPSQPSLDLSGGNAVRSHPRIHAECDSHPRTTRILRIGPVFVGGTDTPFGQPSQLKPLKTKALSSDTGRASPGNHRKYLYMRHSATFRKETLYTKPATPFVSMTF